MGDDGQFSRYFNVGPSSLLKEPNAHKDYNVKRIGPPNDDDWEAAKNFMKFLRLFYNVTKRFSGSLYVTSNNYFHDMCSIHFHITTCMEDHDLDLSVMALKMKEKYDKYWGDVKKMSPLLFVAVILDPRYKQDYVNWSIEGTYGHDKELAAVLKEKADGALKNLYDHYLRENSDLIKEKNVFENANLVETGGDDILDLHEQRLLQFQSFLKSGEHGEKTELEKYLSDAKENIGGAFNVLDWWKANATKYKVLSKIAKDLLAVPVSTVASESAFSTGGRVLDTFRSTLTPKTVQALICAQNWLRNEVSHEEVDLQGVLKDISDLEGIESDFANHLKICSDAVE